MKIEIELHEADLTRLEVKRLVRLATEQMCAPEMEEAFVPGKYAEGSHRGKFKWSFTAS